MAFKPNDAQVAELRERFESYTEVQWRTIPGRFAQFLGSSECRMLLSDQRIAPYLGKLRKLLERTRSEAWSGTREQRYTLLALDYFLDEYDLVRDSVGPEGLDDDIFVMDMCLRKIGVA